MNLVRPITRHDIKGPKLYAPIRDDYRNRVIAMKQHRRVLLGDRVEIVFDNRLLLTLQIEETIRLENLTRDDQLDAEIRLANELMPPPDFRAAFEPGRSEADRISAVQYLRFPLSAAARTSLLTPGTRIAVEIDHPRYHHRVECPEEMRASLAADYGE